MTERRIREILDESEQEQAVRTADLTGAASAITTVAGVVVDALAGVPISPFARVLEKFYDGRKRALIETRVNATVRGLERRLDDLGDHVDKDFITKDEFLEMADEVFERVARERDESKRELYASILANTARVNVNRSFYATALKLLDALAPIHVEILRELRHDQERRKEGGGESNTGTRELAIRLHLEELEELRVAGLSDEIAEIFSKKLKGAAAWDEAIGKAASYGGPRIKALIDTAQGWDDEILKHIWYIGKEGLVHQETQRRSSINELGVELLDWLSEPED